MLSLISGAAGADSSPAASSRRNALAADEGRKGRGPSSGSSVKANEKIPLRLDREERRPEAALSRFRAGSAVNSTDAEAPPAAPAVRRYLPPSVCVRRISAGISLVGGLFSRAFSRLWL